MQTKTYPFPVWSGRLTANVEMPKNRERAGNHPYLSTVRFNLSDTALLTLMSRDD